MKPTPLQLAFAGLISILLLQINPVQAQSEAAGKAPVSLLNVSYDPTRELYEDFNKAFAEHWRKTTGQVVKISQSHGGSGKQARAVIDGLESDVVTLALALDIDEIAKIGGLLDPAWQKRLPDNSSPYTSTIVLLVRKGNPKGVKDWDDLAKPGVAVITPNPKTGGGARWNYLAAWGYANRKFNTDEKKVREFVGAIYKNVAVLDSGARGSTLTFVKNGVGDAYIAWENEALQILSEQTGDNFEIVRPSISILAEPSVAVVDKVVEKHKTRAVSEAYLKYLYTPEGQEIAAKRFYRPRDPRVSAKYEKQFPKIETFTIDAEFGGWQTAQKTHFASGGIFDQIYVSEKK